MTQRSHPFRQAIEADDLDAAADLLHDDVEFRSPAVFRPYRGRAAVERLLRTVAAVFEDFRYVDELHGDGTHALVFRARVGDRQVEGWDYLTVDDEGRITTFVVIVRPLSGLIALAEAMGARLAADPAAS